MNAGKTKLVGEVILVYRQKQEFNTVLHFALYVAIAVVRVKVFTCIPWTVPIRNVIQPQIITRLYVQGIHLLQLLITLNLNLVIRSSD